MSSAFRCFIFQYFPFCTWAMGLFIAVALPLKIRSSQDPLKKKRCNLYRSVRPEVSLVGLYYFQVKTRAMIEATPHFSGAPHISVSLPRPNIDLQKYESEAQPTISNKTNGIECHKRALQPLGQTHSVNEPLQTKIFFRKRATCIAARVLTELPNITATPTPFLCLQYQFLS